MSEHRARLDPAAAWGVPAHVTVLYPFLPPASVDDDVIDRLAGACSGVPRFDCTFGRSAWFADDVLWLAPDPDQPFTALTRRVSREFPGHPPYGGQHPDVVPHLTVGHAESGTAEELRTAEAAIARHLPIVARVDTVLLLAGSQRPGSWRTLAALPLGKEGPHPA